MLDPDTAKDEVEGLRLQFSDQLQQMEAQFDNEHRQASRALSRMRWVQQLHGLDPLTLDARVASQEVAIERELKAFQEKLNSLQKTAEGAVRKAAAWMSATINARASASASGRADADSDDNEEK